MGITICNIHGRSGLVEACSHVAKEIDGGKVPNCHRLMIMGSLFVCDDCFNTLGFQRFASLSGPSTEENMKIWVNDSRMDTFETAYNAIEGRRTFCGSCLKELEGQNLTA